MIEHDELLAKGRAKANFWTAAALIAFALFVAISPFFYLKDVAFQG